MSLADRVGEWPGQWRREGMAEGRLMGMAEGRRVGVVEGRREARREGIEQQRELLARQAALRFGTETGARVGTLLADMRPPRFGAAAQWIVGAPTGMHLTAWLWRLGERTGPPPEVPLDEGTLQEAIGSLSACMAEASQKWRYRGMAEGHREGVAEGRREGLAEGRREGRREGAEQQRKLLADQAEDRFGTETGARVGTLLAGVEHADRLAAAAEWIVGAETAAELTARLRAEANRAS